EPDRDQACWRRHDHHLLRQGGRALASHGVNQHPAPQLDLRWVLFAAILASSMAFIDSTALNVGLPAIQADLQASGAQLLWIVNAYLLMLAALILLGGA